MTDANPGNVESVGGASVYSQMAEIKDSYEVMRGWLIPSSAKPVN